MRFVTGSERGAALIIVMLVTVIMFILVTAMLTRTSSELVIAGLHRDSTRAFENAQAGLEEAVRRIAAPHLFEQFDGSTSSGISVRVLRHAVGGGGSVMEIQSDATVGLARRRLSLLVLQIVEEMIPEIMFGRQIGAQAAGNAQVKGGDVYSQWDVRYGQKLPENPNTRTYAGWRISKGNPGPIAYCYTSSPPCTGQPKWFPGHRRAEYDATVLPGGYDFATIGAALDVACPISDSDLQRGISKTVSTSGIGWTANDKQHDKDPVPDANNMPAAQRLYDCTSDDLPYLWIRERVRETDGNTEYDMWFRVISFEQWFDKYWNFNALEWKFTGSDAQGAVPPPPPFERLARTFNRKDTDGKINNGDDFGTCVNPVNNICDEDDSRRMIVLLDTGNAADTWNAPPFGPSGPDGRPHGHGTLLVNGNLKIAGNLTYYGTIVVNGEIEVAAGTVKIFGGLIGKAKVAPKGTLEITAGTLSNTIPVGRATVERRAWFER